MSPRSEAVEANTWLLANSGFAGDGCLIWPFTRYGNGRGWLYRGDNLQLAHRAMCELVHGPCPPTLECRHLCGNGHLACVNPKHLIWDTRSANQLDRRKHGTHATNKFGCVSKLTPEQIREIRATAGIESNVDTGKRFGRHAETIRYWRTTTHEPMKPGTSRSAIEQRAKREARARG